MAYPAQTDRPSFLENAQQQLRVVWDRARGGRTAEPEEDAGPAAAGGARRHKGAIIAGSIAAALLLVIALFLLLWDWDYARGPIARYASGRIGRPVAIDGHLRVKLLTWTPTARVQGLRIANPPDRPGDMTKVETLVVSVDLRQLIHGKTILPLVEADRPTINLYRRADGTNNWTFKGKSPGEPTRLPAIRRFEINDGHLTIEDGVRHLKFVGKMSSSEVVGAQTVQGFRLDGDGRLNAEPFTLKMTGGPLLNVDPDRPYPFNADVRAGATRIQANGSITRPFDLGVFTTKLDVTGPDAADLYYLTGLALPSTPPYTVTGTLNRNGRVYRYTGLNGRVGDSDLHGWVGVNTTGKRPMLTGDLSSRVLTFKDLQTVMGGGSTSRRAGPIKASQVKAANALAATGRILPDAPLDMERIRKMDADVRYRAQSIRSAKLPITAGSAHITLNNALLKLNDLTFTLPQGKVAGQVAVNGRGSVPVVDLDMRMTGAQLASFLPARFKNGAVSASLVGRAKLHGVGKSVHDAASNASGSLTVVAPSGQIDRTLAELMGVNVTRALGLMLTKKKESTPIRCAVADFQAKDGVLYANQLVMDTEPVLLSGGGTINLGSERLDLKVKGKAKKFELIHLIVPVRLQGQLGHPQVKLETGTAVGQVGIGAALGTLLAPLATILPFVDGGLAKDANCAALMGGTAQPVAAKR